MFIATVEIPAPLIIFNRNKLFSDLSKYECTSFWFIRAKETTTLVTSICWLPAVAVNVSKCSQYGKVD